MNPRKAEVAKLARVQVVQVVPATVEQVLEAYQGKVAPEILEAATMPGDEPCYYWQVGKRFFLDDAAWGPVCAIDDLRLDEIYGLHPADMDKGAEHA